MKRRILSLILAFVLIVTMIPVGTVTTLAAPAAAQRKTSEIMRPQTAPAAAQTKSSETVTYSVPGGSILFDPQTGTVTGCEGAPTKVDVPATINGVKVVAIGGYAFVDCASLTEVVLPNGLTTIDDYAFFSCTSLTEIVFPNGLTSIGVGAFQSCYRLAAIALPSSLKTIEEAAFAGCDRLSNISIPNGVTTIGDFAFRASMCLERVDIPASVTTIGAGAFSICLALKGIWVNENNPNYSSDSNGILFNKNKTELLAYPCAFGGSYAVPNGVITIGDSAFDNCDNLTAITFPNSLTTIGDSAFYGCYNLTAITFPDSLTTIGNGAFIWCNGLTSIAFPNSVTMIGDDAFSSCCALDRVDIPASVTIIGSGAFSCCTALKGIWVNENNPNYSSDSNGILFNKNKTELLAYPCTFGGSYAIPNGVTTIGDSAFEHCYNLTAITFPDSLTAIGDSAFYWCDGLTSIALPDSLTTIGNHAFGSCYNLSAIAFPDHLEYIGSQAFPNCEKLSSLTIPDGVTTIDDWAFDSCYSLESVAIPASVTYIGSDVFGECPYLSHIYYGGSQAQWAQISFYNDFSGIAIHYNETAPWHSCPSNDFADTPFFNNWAHNGIDYCVEQELMNGTGSNLFNPNGTVSRAQLVTILYRMAGSPETEFKGTFTDVADGLWYSDAIEWAAANGVVNGIGSGKFGPDQSITREQIATILHRYKGTPQVTGNLDAFPDKDSVSGFAVDGLIWATQKGLINGIFSNGITTLAPKSNATRAQIASIIMRYRESIQAA